MFKWATDEERTKLLATLGEKGDKGLGEAVSSAPSAGYVWTSESLGYPIRYAATVSLPSGGERVIVLTDKRLGAWSGAPWKAATDPNDYQYHADRAAALEIGQRRKGRCRSAARSAPIRRRRPSRSKATTARPCS